jgi:2-desacetyl-2-hydroxyethyl bacteriochlorophyllide A dehydrogenase
MKAAVLYGPRDVRFEEVDDPKLEPGQVLLRVRACGICGSDLHAYKLNQYPELGAPAGVGIILGHEFSGEVAKLGEGVQGLNIGDRVLGLANGGNAEYIKISAMARMLCLPIPQNVSFEEAATNEPLATSLHGVNLAEPKDDQTIVVMGTGLIGLGVIQVLRTMCKAKIGAVDVSEKRLEMAKKLGADVILNARQEDPYQWALKTTGSMKIQYLEFPVSGVDTVIDCAGYSAESKGPPPLWQALQMVKQNGRVILVSVFEKPTELDVNIIMRKNIYFIGSWGWAPLEFLAAFEMIKSGKVDRKPLITHTFPLSEGKKAYETQLNAREAIKVMLIT